MIVMVNLSLIKMIITTTMKMIVTTMILTNIARILTITVFYFISQWAQD